MTLNLEIASSRSLLLVLVLLGLCSRYTVVDFWVLDSSNASCSWQAGREGPDSQTLERTPSRHTVRVHPPLPPLAPPILERNEAAPLCLIQSSTPILREYPSCHSLFRVWGCHEQNYDHEFHIDNLFSTSVSLFLLHQVTTQQTTSAILRHFTPILNALHELTWEHLSTYLRQVSLFYEDAL